MYSINDNITLSVLNLFVKDVLSQLSLDSDEITFIQSDNGQLDTTAVKSLLCKRKLFSNFISAYHPNMNGFVERAFRSVKDLARCMMQSASLPDPYWEKAFGHTVLLRNIMPNQTVHGYVREAYYLWFGLTYDYSRVHTLGSCAYVLNHVHGNDYGARSEAGIFVGMKPQHPLTYKYELYFSLKMFS